MSKAPLLRGRHAHRVIVRADAEISAGRIWRAREILGGTIANGCSDSEVLEVGTPLGN